MRVGKRALLRQDPEGSWSPCALLACALRHPELTTWAQVLVAAEGEGCPREVTDAFVLHLDDGLSSVGAVGRVDPDGIFGVASECGVTLNVRGYDRKADGRALTDASRASRNARYLQKLLRKGKIARVGDVEGEVAEQVLHPDDRVLVARLIRSAKVNGQGRLNMALLQQSLQEIGIDPTRWTTPPMSVVVKGRLAALRIDADATAHRRAQEEAAALAKVGAEVAAAGARQASVPPQPREEPPDVEEPEHAPHVDVVPPKKRSYVRRVRDLTPKAAPVVITRPVARDVAVHELMRFVLAALAEEAGCAVPFIPGVVMRALADIAFETYGLPAVGVTQLGYKGYATNVGEGVHALWRVEPVEVGDLQVPPETRFLEEAGATIVRNARERDPEAFAAGVAQATSAAFAQYAYSVDSTVREPEAEDAPEAHKDSDGAGDGDVDCGGCADTADVEGVGDGESEAVVPVTAQVDEAMVEALVRRLLDEQPKPPVVTFDTVRGMVKEVTDAWQQPLGEARIVELIKQHAPKPEPVPEPKLDQALVDAAVRDALAQLLPGAVRDAVEKEIARAAEERGRINQHHQAELTRMRAELAEAERAASDARLMEAAAALLQKAIARAPRS